jgi:hypothetical protein
VYAICSSEDDDSRSAPSASRSVAQSATTSSASIGGEGNASQQPQQEQQQQQQASMSPPQPSADVERLSSLEVVCRELREELRLMRGSGSADQPSPPTAAAMPVPTSQLPEKRSLHDEVPFPIHVQLKMLALSNRLLVTLSLAA